MNLLFQRAKDYYKRIEAVMNLIIFQDIPLVGDISFATLQKARTLLSIIAKIVISRLMMWNSISATAYLYGCSAFCIESTIQKK